MKTSAKLFFGLSIALAVIALLSASMVVTRFWTKIPNYGSDIRLRMNECQCVRLRINPKDVFDGKVSQPPFHPLNRRPEDPVRFNKPIDVYTPWEYSVMLPLSRLPEPLAECIWFSIIVSAVAFLGMLAYAIGKSSRGKSADGRLAAAFALAMPIAIFCDAMVGNFACTITAALALMALALNRGHTALAGLALAFAMFKPQYGALIAFALLLQRQWLTVAVGAVLCFVATLPAALLCHTSPIDLILQSTQGGGAEAFLTQGCDLLPYPLAPILTTAGISKGLLIAAPALVGIALCILFMRRLRDESDWFLLLVPAATLATVWTYTTPGSRMLNWFLLLAVARALITKPGRFGTWPIVLLLLANLRPFECVYQFLVMSSGVLAAWQLPRTVVLCAHAIENTFALCVSLGFLAQLTRQNEVGISSQP